MIIKLELYQFILALKKKKKELELLCSDKSHLLLTISLYYQTSRS